MKYLSHWWVTKLNIVCHTMYLNVNRANIIWFKSKSKTSSHVFDPLCDQNCAWNLCTVVWQELHVFCIPKNNCLHDWNNTQIMLQCLFLGKQLSFPSWSGGSFMGSKRQQDFNEPLMHPFSSWKAIDSKLELPQRNSKLSVHTFFPI